MKGGGERRDLFKRATVNRGTKEHPRVEWCRQPLGSPLAPMRARRVAPALAAGAAAFIGVAIESFSIWKLTE